MGDVGRGERLLLVVEDTFAIKGRGVLVAPDVDFRDGHRRRLVVELRRPDGTRLAAFAEATVTFVHPLKLPPRLRHVLAFGELTTDELPIGTEVWIVDAAERL